MGCDIHLYVEKKTKNKWVTAEKWERFHDDINPSVPYESQFYTNRNYDLFAILANVRNGRGFAGISTGEGFNPIAMERGIPEDACDLVKAQAVGWGNDGHSHSWLTMEEILDFDWTQRTKKSGTVNGQEYYRWSQFHKKHGEGPDRYCGRVSGPAVTNISAKEMDKKIEKILSTPKAYSDQMDLIKAQLENTYCEIKWSTAYYTACSDFWSETIPRLLKVGKPKNVRIVFWFDN